MQLKQIMGAVAILWNPSEELFLNELCGAKVLPGSQDATQAIRKAILSFRNGHKLKYRVL